MHRPQLIPDRCGRLRPRGRARDGGYGAGPSLSKGAAREHCGVGNSQRCSREHGVGASRPVRLAGSMPREEDPTNEGEGPIMKTSRPVLLRLGALGDRAEAGPGAPARSSAAVLRLRRGRGRPALRDRIPRSSGDLSRSAERRSPGRLDAARHRVGRDDRRAPDRIGGAGDSQPGSLAQSVEALDLSGSLANLFCCYFGSVPPASTAPLVTSVGSLAAAVAGAPMIRQSVADLGVAPPLLPALPPLSRIPAR